MARNKGGGTTVTSGNNRICQYESKFNSEEATVSLILVFNYSNQQYNSKFITTRVIWTTTQYVK